MIIERRNSKKEAATARKCENFKRLFRYSAIGERIYTISILIKVSSITQEI
jgi:hypothetical protein